MDIITQRLSTNTVSLPEWAKEVINARNASSFIRKGLSLDDLKFVEDERSAIHTITSTEIDRDGEIVVPKGLYFKNFERNGKPVLWCHQYSSLPIGSCQWVKHDKNVNSVIAKTRFGKHQLANDVYEHIKEHPLSASIGFIPIKWIDQDEYDSFDFKSYGLDPSIAKKARRIYTEAELLEFSIVPVPSNPSACQMAVSKGLISLEEIKNIGYVYEIINILGEKKGESDNGNEKQAEEKEQAKEVEGSASSDGEKGEVIEFDISDLVTKPETTENYHRIPVSDGHDDHEIRTIVISAKKGIKALYCTDCKKIKTYLFNTEKWSMEEARQWIEDHSKSIDKDVLYCECEEPDFVEDECRGCGGRRKPRKPKKEFIEEIDDIGFGEVMSDEPNPLEIKAVEDSENVEFVNDLLDVIQLMSERVFVLEKRIADLSNISTTINIEETEEKAGRTLSKKTREIIQRAIDALNDLMKGSSSSDDEEEEDDDEDKKLSISDITIEKSEIVEKTETIEDDKIEKAVKEVISELMSSSMIDAKSLVEEALKRQKGKMF